MKNFSSNLRLMFTEGRREAEPPEIGEARQADAGM